MGEPFEKRYILTTYPALLMELGIYSCSLEKQLKLLPSIEKKYKSLLNARHHYSKYLQLRDHEEPSMVISLCDDALEKAKHILYVNENSKANMSRVLRRILSISGQSEEEYNSRSFEYRMPDSSYVEATVLSSYNRLLTINWNLSNSLHLLDKTKSSVLILTSREAALEMMGRLTNISLLTSGSDYVLLGKLEEDKLGDVASSILSFVEKYGFDIDRVGSQKLCSIKNKRK